VHSWATWGGGGGGGGGGGVRGGGVWSVRAGGARRCSRMGSVEQLGGLEGEVGLWRD